MRIKSAFKIAIMFMTIYAFFFLRVENAFSDSWRTEKGIHFIVRYSSDESSSWARSILRAAETYYRRIADNINYSRYENFWTWDERVIIVVYPDKKTFLSMTNQPYWSKGGAFRDEALLKTKMIVTFKQEEGFIDGVLPHEISHLILGDFVGFDKAIPVWFNEGVAQLQERRKTAIVRPFMKKMIESNNHMPLNVLMNSRVQNMVDFKDVALFYAQSLSVIDFLIVKYGSNKFGELCVIFRNKNNLEEALKSTYLFDFESISELEKKWLRYVKN